GRCGVSRATAGRRRAFRATAGRRHVPEEPVGGLPPLPHHVPEEPMGRLPPRPGPEHLLGFLWGVFMELTPDSRPTGATPDSKAPTDTTLDSKPDMTPDTTLDSKPDTTPDTTPDNTTPDMTPDDTTPDNTTPDTKPWPKSPGAQSKTKSQRFLSGSKPDAMPKSPGSLPGSKPEARPKSTRRRSFELTLLSPCLSAFWSSTKQHYDTNQTFTSCNNY
ncbi:hypothetical protein CRENBAI_022710, partial [Crenichthys baileyi]